VVNAARPATVDAAIAPGRGDHRPGSTANDRSDGAGHDGTRRNARRRADSLPLRRAGTKAKAGKHDESKLPHGEIS
jgi:hypothetical protein